MNSHVLRNVACCILSSAVLLSGAVILPAQTKKPRPIYDPTSHKANVRTESIPKLVSPMDASSSGSSCTLITFEGLGDLAAIPDFYGISLPDWLSIIEDNAGGSGNFANEPSPVTIAFWLDGNPTSQSINIPNGASQISLYYSSAYSITLTGYDAKGNLLTTVSGDANFDSSTEVYDIWSPLTINAPSGTTIASLSVSGYANYTGIDNLNVCQSPQIGSVEVTQAIQQYQTLADLKTSLQTNNEPPVPIIAGKPAVLRVYFNKVEQVSPVTVNLSGVSTQSKQQTLQPNCTAQQERSGTNGCPSVDFYFTPPTGSWSATLDVLDSSGTNVEEETLPVTSRTTSTLGLSGVSVCDAKDASGNWLCASASDLLSRVGLVTKIAPTSSVVTSVTNDIVQNDSATYANAGGWWPDTVAKVNSFYGIFAKLSDLVQGRRTTYFGMVRPAPAAPAADPLGGTGGIAVGIPSNAAIGRTSALRFNNNTETTVEVIAHETSHTLGLKHTNTDNPSVVAAPPGCYNFASDGSTNWMYPTGTAASTSNTNFIQSTSTASGPTYEVGFDVVNHSTVDPSSHFDVESYCSPRWISPQRYKTMIATLGGGAVASPSVEQAQKHASDTPAKAPAENVSPAQGTTTQSFWLVSGTINGNSVTFNPIFQITAQADTTSGSGTYSLNVLGSTGNVIFTRQFTPSTPATETSGTDTAGTPAFSEMIPVTSGAASIVLLDPQSNKLGSIALGGTPPTVAITSPASGVVATGIRNVTWTVQGPTNYTSMVLYSPDNGATWSMLGEVQNASSLAVNFDQLPASTQALIEVLVSDGVNTGSATSPAFTVPRKSGPSVAVINSPSSNFSQPAADPLLLVGSVYDVDDGVLTGSALKWSDNVSGNLGTGSPLRVTLKPGAHVITLTGTNSGGNTITATTNIVLGGQPPVVSLTGQALNTAPTTCEFATVTATPGSNGGAPLSLVQYSVDGGNTYTTVPLASLPYGFLVQGTGFLHLVARAYDVSGQSNAQDATFFIQSACGLSTQTITFNALANQTFGVSPLTLAAAASSGLPVAYTVTGPATITGSTLTVTGAGTVTVTATQAGNSTYAPASWVSHSFTVSAATPTIKWAAPAAITYGTTLSGVLNATAANGQTNVAGAFTYSAQPASGSATPVTATTILTAGTYTLAAQFNPTDTTDYNSATGSVSLTVNKAAPTVAVSSNANPVFAQSAVTLTATVASTISAPTGSVNFVDGSTTIGSASLTNGSAIYTTTTLSAGSHSITAVYAGDANFSTTTSSALAENIADFSLTVPGSSSQTVKGGSPATYSLTVAPVGVSSVPAAVALSASGLPTGATATFSPSNVPSGSASTTVTMTVQTTASARMEGVRLFGKGAIPLLLSILVLPFTRRTRLLSKRIRSLLSLAMLFLVGVAIATGISSCGGSSSSKIIQPQNYTITVTGTSGSLSHTTTVSLTVD